MFQVNQALIEKARPIFAGRPNIYWVLGGAGAGKSTICRAIAERNGVAVYDMDEHIYGTYFPRYTPQRHPANTTWLSAENPLAWALELTPDAYNTFNRAATAEYLDLLAEDLAAWPPAQPVLIDGGITHPSIAAQVLAPRQMVCLTTTDEERVRLWETDATRAEMRDWIRALPQPERMWQQFLAHDAMISSVMERESRACGVAVFARRPHDSVGALAGRVARRLGLTIGIEALAGRARSSEKTG